MNQRPTTLDDLRRDLAALGVGRDSTLIVHSSLSAIGFVLGGAATVVHALLEAVGARGTLAMPAATPQCGDPQGWADPEASESWLTEVREGLSLFERHTTPSTMGAIAESFRNWPGTRRSDHPLESVCARGPLAATITAEHSLSFSEGRGTPFEQLYEVESRVLLLGVGFNRCTALHFAESLVDKRRTKVSRFAVERDGRKIWIEVPDMADDDDTHFPQLGAEYLSAGRAKQGTIGEARSILFCMPDLVDFAVRYFERVL